MAEAPAPESGGISGWVIFFVLLVLVVLWLRQGGWNEFMQKKIDFGWKPASTTEAFPFAPNFQDIAPKVAMPDGPGGPAGPGGPQGP